MLIPPAMPRTGKITVKGDKNIDYYEIAARQISQQILPLGLPATTVWAYGPNTVPNGKAIFHSPSLTLEAEWGRPVRVKWINELVRDDGSFLPHLLPVDPTLHWANPPGGENGRDTRPTFSLTPGPYTGPVPLVTHLHGAVGVGDESDGYAEAWFLPDAGNIPSGFATEGTWYDFFAGKANAQFGASWGPGFAVSQYPNNERASTKWYHDHTLGMTRLNVYAGLAGFYLLRGGPEDEVKDVRTGGKAVLPGPAPSVQNPPGANYHEIPIAIQDRSFNSDGSLFYPDTRAFFDGVAGPYIPFSDISPIWNPEFFGNTMMVNGNTWPFQVVEQRRYRLRFLNGCQSRFLILDFSAILGVEVWQIGNEGGFLAEPVNITVDHRNQILLAPAERADCIVDFTDVPLASYVLRNVGPDEPFAGGIPGTDFAPADEDTTGQILQFRVVPARGRDHATPPEFLELPAVTALPTATVTRRLALLEETSVSEESPGVPTEALLGTVAGDPAVWTAQHWDDPISENPALGATEVWEFYNTTGDAHPMHIHEVAFAVVDRQDIVVDEVDQTVELVEGTVTPPEPWETGFKDTVIAYPGQVTRVQMTFGVPGQFVWHCHIVEHEDNEMMRPYRIGPVQPGQPPE
ncbi:multicopper oxidase [Nannocystis sp. ILAH1]|uniref:multicopper oxidase family protein n=1 Tax=Nannocystis sp. ILAH1 TaxID=2996789 RepID=UPI00226FA508|nr:multicopper oxidase [Nannocystis sp. ILAH1]MCY0989784.1 multicopper oxidase [Nannocystis sp. ILAH1]